MGPPGWSEPNPHIQPFLSIFTQTHKAISSLQQIYTIFGYSLFLYLLVPHAAFTSSPVQHCFQQHQFEFKTLCLNLSLDISLQYLTSSVDSVIEMKILYSKLTAKKIL